MRWLWAGYPQPLRITSVRSNAIPSARFLTPRLTGNWSAIVFSCLTEGPAADKSGQGFLFARSKEERHFSRRLTERRRPQHSRGHRKSVRPCFWSRWQAIRCRPAWNHNVRCKRQSCKNRGRNLAQTISRSAPKETSISATRRTQGLVRQRCAWIETAEIITEGLFFPNGVQLSADESLLLVADTNTRTVWSWQIQPDGSVANGQPYYSWRSRKNRTGNTDSQLSPTA